MSTMVKKPTIREFWIYTSKNLTGYNFTPGSTGVHVTSNISGGGGVLMPLNHNVLPQLMKLDVGEKFELVGELIRQKISPKGKLISQEITPKVRQTFVVSLDDTGNKVAWRIV